MAKNDAQSFDKIPSASWIRQIIQEEVKKQLEERTDQVQCEVGADGFDGWFIDERRPRSTKKEVTQEKREAGQSEWDFWAGGDLLGGPLGGFGQEEESKESKESHREEVISSEAIKAAEEEGELQAIISPVISSSVPRARKSAATGSRLRPKRK